MHISNPCVPRLKLKLKLKLIYDRQSVAQSVRVPGTQLGPVTNFFSLLEIFFRQLRVCYFVALSLTRGRICNLLYNCFWPLPEQVTLGSKSCRTHGHILLSHLRQCSLFVASYDSQGLRWRYSNPPPGSCLYNFGADSIGNTVSNLSPIGVLTLRCSDTCMSRGRVFSMALPSSEQCLGTCSRWNSVVLFLHACWR
jgi:hypothetical protein